MNEFESYNSPYHWRYGSDEIRHIWSEVRKRQLWRKIWVALAAVQSEFGLVNSKQVADLRSNVVQIDVRRALEIEAEIRHDLMAEIKVFAEQCQIGGGVIHMGATSVDIKDNATVLQVMSSLNLLIKKISSLLYILAQSIKQYAEVPIIAFTHLQPAEPTTLGYRLALYAQDLLTDRRLLIQMRGELRGKGFKGAVGTSASYAELIGSSNLYHFEERLSEILDLPFYLITNQTYPRKQDYQVLSVLAGLGASLSKIAFDLRILQIPAIGEAREPFGTNQVGSSTMPFKRNPIRTEKINSLARLLAQLPRVAWDNASLSLLERTLDDSANRRSILPEAFLISDELLRETEKVFSGLNFDRAAMKRNLDSYAPFAATERILMACSKAGADRQVIHERLRKHSLKAWGTLESGESNPLLSMILQDKEFGKFLSGDEIRELMDVQTYLGAAPERARSMAQLILDEIQ